MFENLEIEKKFYNEIAELVSGGNINHLDAITHWSAKHDVEMEVVAAMVSKNLNMKSCLQRNAEILRYLKPGVALSGGHVFDAPIYHTRWIIAKQVESALNCAPK
jgi:hypothetical protein